MNEPQSRREPEPSNEATSFQSDAPELEVEIRDEVPFHIPRD